MDGIDQQQYLTELAISPLKKFAKKIEKQPIL
jgi:hypothetical protein